MGGDGDRVVTTGAGGGHRPHEAEVTLRVIYLDVGLWKRELLGAIDVALCAGGEPSGETEVEHVSSADPDDKGIAPLSGGVQLMDHDPEVDTLRWTGGGGPASTVGIHRIVTQYALFHLIPGAAVKPETAMARIALGGGDDAAAGHCLRVSDTEGEGLVHADVTGNPFLLRTLEQSDIAVTLDADGVGAFRRFRNRRIKRPEVDAVVALGG